MRTAHEITLRDNAHYLRNKGYVLIVNDLDGRGFKPDILAMHPATKSLLWIEIINKQRGKQGFLSETKAEYAGSVMERLGGEVKILYAGQDDMVDLPERSKGGD